MGAIIRTGAEKKENEIIIEDLQKLQGAMARHISKI